MGDTAPIQRWINPANLFDIQRGHPVKLNFRVYFAITPGDPRYVQHIAAPESSLILAHLDLIYWRLF